MKKIESLFIGISLFSVLAIAGVFLYNSVSVTGQGGISYKVPETKYGSFLAAQHAIYSNDFDNAVRFTASLSDVEYPVVYNARILADFLSGKMPSDVSVLKEDKGISARFIYDAHLVQNKQWSEFHARHKKDMSVLTAPLRIWSAIANDWRTNTFKYIDGLSTNESWKSFVRGQIYAQLGNADEAAKHFAMVTSDFMNINDYLYIMSFYRHHGKTELAELLYNNFTSRPAGMFLSDYENIPDWSLFSGYENSLAFSLIQTVSHTQVLMYSDMAVLMLRFAQIIAPELAQTNNVVDYYLGQYFFNKSGDGMRFFERIEQTSPFYLFASLRTFEKTGDITLLKRALSQRPLFVPAINKLVGHYIRIGDRSAALAVIRRALSSDVLDEAGRAFFIKSRAQIHYAFGDFDAAQSDIRTASDILLPDAEIVALQAKIWAAQNREIENAYKYAMTLVTQNPADILAWDTLGVVVAVREGVDAALDLLSRVGEVSVTHSELFMHIGDMYAVKGDVDKARAAYIRAIDLSDDGLIVVPEIEKKLRKLK
ncbi:MAG: hypothetical protein UIH99_01370 [Alphaproteobacteria bacterium]|nr:hypothetical protein [Alphaproteobacteria bacterium]